MRRVDQARVDKKRKETLKKHMPAHVRTHIHIHTRTKSIFWHNAFFVKNYRDKIANKKREKKT